MRHDAFAASSCVNTLSRPVKNVVKKDRFDDSNFRQTLRSKILNNEILSDVKEIREDANTILEMLVTMEQDIVLNEERKAFFDQIRSTLTGTFNYETYVDATLRFISLAEDIKVGPNLQYLQADSPSTYYIAAKKRFDSDYDLLKKKNTNFFVFLPTPRDLNHRKLMVLFGDGILPIGLTQNKLKVDGTSMTPFGFYFHDVGHGRLWSKIFAYMPENQRSITLEKFAVLNEQVIKKIDQFGDEGERNRLNFLWFVSPHERQKIILSLTDAKTIYENPNLGGVEEILKSEIIHRVQYATDPEFSASTTTDLNTWKESYSNFIEIIKSLEKPNSNL